MAKLLGGTTVAGDLTVSGNTYTATPTTGDNSTKAATTAFVQSAIAGFSGMLTTALTGLSTATSSVITATDTVLSALGKLQAQVTILASTSYQAGAIDPYQAFGTIDVVSRVNSVNNFTITPGTVFFTCFTPSATVTVSQLSVATGSGAAMSGATLVRLGLYTFNDSTATATLVAQTANDTSIFASSSTLYTRSFSATGGYPATYTLQAGQRYAVGIIVVTYNTGNGPAVAGANTNGFVTNMLPYMARQKITQADLPASAVTTQGYLMIATRLL